MIVDWQLAVVIVIVALAAVRLTWELKRGLYGSKGPRGCGGGCSNCPDAKAVTPHLVTLELPIQRDPHSLRS